MTYFLETSELGFRNWSDSDFQFAHQLWSNPDVTQTLFADGPLTDIEIRELLKSEIANVKKFGVQYWPFFSLKNNEFIGVCGLRPYKLFEGIFQLSIQILPQYWHKGYGFQATSAMIEYTINTLNIKSIFAGHHPQNTNSATLLKKLGFKYTHLEFFSETGVNQASYILNAEERPDSI
jgi:RimJ/RimL family protein N-acetyltransferase